MARPSWNFGSRRLIHLEYESVLVSLEHLGGPILNTLDLSICSEWIPFIELNCHQVALARHVSAVSSHASWNSSHLGIRAILEFEPSWNSSSFPQTVKLVEQCRDPCGLVL
jgi:hypothetical protein